MAEYLTNTEDMKIVADAIRAKGGTAAPLEFPQGMADAVAAISGGGIPTTGPRFISETIYTQAEDWIDNPIGSTANFVYTYCDRKNLEPGEFFFAIVSGNKAPGTKYANTAMAFNFPWMDMDYWCWRGGGLTGIHISNNNDFPITRGAKIRVLRYSTEEAK